MLACASAFSSNASCSRTARNIASITLHLSGDPTPSSADVRMTGWSSSARRDAHAEIARNRRDC
jgi:hypothetical protein